MNHRALVLAGVLGVALAGSLWAEVPPTAYEALRILAGQKGEGLLGRVTEVTGRQGSPQPLVWRVVVADPQARGGVREFEVSGGRVLSERTPVVRIAGSAAEATVPMTALKLDSDGAFRVANAEAYRARVGFDSASYTLVKADGSGVPLWVVELFDDAGRSVGVLRISGVDGQVLSAKGLGERTPGPTTWPKTDVMPDNGDGGFLGRTSRTLDKAGRWIKNGSIRAAGTVQYWFTGNQTIGAPDPGVPEPDDFD